MPRTFVKTHARILLLAAALIGSFAAVGIAQAISVPSTAIPTLMATIDDHGQLATKAAFIGRQATAFANAPKGRALTVGPPTPDSRPTSTPQTGIFDIQISPFGSYEAIIANQWFGYVAGQRTGVYAGRLTQPADQGFVAVVTGHIGQADFVLQQYPTPTRSGSVTIVAENGTRLTLRSTTGVQYVFDVATRSYVSNP